MALTKIARELLKRRLIACIEKQRRWCHRAPVQPKSDEAPSDRHHAAQARVMPTAAARCEASPWRSTETVPELWEYADSYVDIGRGRATGVEEGRALGPVGAGVRTIVEVTICCTTTGPVTRRHLIWGGTLQTGGAIIEETAFSALRNFADRRSASKVRVPAKETTQAGQRSKGSRG